MANNSARLLPSVWQLDLGCGLLLGRPDQPLVSQIGVGRLHVNGEEILLLMPPKI